MPALELAPGARVAGYQIEAPIGRGGMGAVYRAEERALGRKVALKVIAPELAQDERFRERFLRESRIAASLDHPHIVPIYSAGEEEGVLFLAMRYVEGTDLAKLMRAEGALDPARTISLLDQVAEALDAAHEKGLVHRDVKPSNVLVAVAAGKEHCYLADFGLTKRTGSLSGVSAPGDVVGTLEYVAPEQITGDEVDARADLYSLACVLYECLTGRPPFPRATDVALLWAHVHDEPQRPSEVLPGLPDALDTVMARALAKEPESRYRTCAELTAAVRSALGIVEDVPASKARLSLVIAPVVVIALAAALAVVLTRGSGDLASVSPDAVGVIEPTSNELVDEVLLGARPEGVAVGLGAVWVTQSDGTVSSVDPETHRVNGTIKVIAPQRGYLSDVVVSGRLPELLDGSSVRPTVWSAAVEGRVDAFSTPTGVTTGDAFSPLPSWFDVQSELTGEIPLSGLRCQNPAAVAVATKALWYTCGTPVLRIDLRTRQTTFVEAVGYRGSAHLGSPVHSDVAFGLGSVWLAAANANTVTEVDPSTGGMVQQITVGDSPRALAVGSGSLWVASFEDDSVWRVDVSGPVTTERIPVGDGPVDVAATDDAVWVTNSLGGTLSRIDPEKNEVVATVHVGNVPRRVAVGEGAVWVTVQTSEP